jgi:hypothetical protein
MHPIAPTRAAGSGGAETRGFDCRGAGGGATLPPGERAGPHHLAAVDAAGLRAAGQPGTETRGDDVRGGGT